MNKQKKPEKLFTSIIIPVLNGENLIGRCLESIFAMNASKDLYEVIVVDNGSTDRTVEIARGYGVKTLSIPGVTIAGVRNHGAKHAKGDLLAFLDSDCLVARDWLKNALPYFGEEDIGMAGSLCSPPGDATWVGKAWDLCIKKRRYKGEIDSLGSANMIVRRVSFDRVNGFTAELVTCEDDDLCHKLREAGYRIYSDPAVKVYHLGEYRTLSRFFKKEIWRGKETFKLFLRYRGRMSLKVLVYALFYLVTLLLVLFSIPWAIVSPRGLPALFLLSAVALTPSLLFATATAIRSGKWAYFFHFMVLFFVFGVSRAVAICRVKWF